MSETMAKAIFSKRFAYTSPTRNAGWEAKASDAPQSFPREFIDAAVAAGAAVEVPHKRKAAVSPDDNSDQ